MRHDTSLKRKTCDDLALKKENIILKSNVNQDMIKKELKIITIVYYSLDQHFHRL